jgi:phage-related protein (TIGR01555 family)
MADGLQNVVANLGTDRDKAAFSTYAAPVLSPYALQNAYRGAWLPRKIVDIPALDSCRKWRDWQAEKDQITMIEAEEVRLGVKLKVLKARVAARLFGGAALMIGDGATDPSLPLLPETIKAGGLKYVTLLHKRQLSAVDLDRNPASDYFGAPAMWMLSVGAASAPRVHPSRLVIFHGAQSPDPEMSNTEIGWGDSVLQAIMDAVMNVDATAANIASLVFEAKVDTVGIPELMQKLGDSGYEEVLLKRWRLAMTGKGINGALMHDAEEIIGQKTASFSGLPEVLDRFMMIAAGAADIPMTRLMGQAPGGMNATGESDTRNYYDRVSASQELEMGPAMSVLDECLIRSALGARPEEVHYRWASLWQVSDTERATIGKTHADMIKVLRDTQLIPDQPLAEAAVNLLTESGAMPGLEGAVDQWETENPDGADGPDTIEAATTPEVKPEVDPLQNDAAPRTLYVRRNVVNTKDIIAWAKEQGFKTTLEASDLHVTIAFSRTPVDWMKVGEVWQAEVEVAAGGPRLMEAFGASKVLLFASSHLSWRHEEIKNTGASWDHAEYQPHITISYADDAPDLATVTPYAGKIVLGPEIFQEVKDDWQQSIKEV